MPDIRTWIAGRTAGTPGAGDSTLFVTGGNARKADLASQYATVDALDNAVIGEADLSSVARVFQVSPPSGGDDRSAIQTALDAASSAGGGTVQLARGTYLLATKNGADGTKHALEIKSNTRLIGAGIGATIVKADDDLAGDTPLIWFKAQHDIEIAHFTIDGNRSRPAAGGEDEGIDGYGGERFWFHHLRIIECTGDGIDLDRFEGTGSHVFTDSVLVEDCNGVGLHNAFSYSTTVNCMAFRCGQERALSENPVVANDACGMDIKGAYSRLANCTIINCVRGINIANIEDPQVVGCFVHGSDQEGLWVGSAGAPANVSVSGSRFIATNGVAAVRLTAAARVIVSDCYINGGTSTTEAVLIDGASNAVVSNCQIVPANAGRGIRVTSAGGVWRVAGCHFLNQTGVGIRVEASDGVVSDCTRYQTTSIALIDIRGPRSNVVVKGCYQASGVVGVRFLNEGGTPSNCVVVHNHFPDGITAAGTGHTIEQNTPASAF